MAVLVQMSVKVPDVDRFLTAVDKFGPLMEEMGARDRRTLQSEADPSLMSLVSEWDSHDAMHAASEKYGDEMNAAAGTEGLPWETFIWHRR
jgi:Antibiotic biosynthesis monooxygenase